MSDPSYLIYRLEQADANIERLTAEITRMDKRTRHLLDRIEGAELALKVWDSSQKSEYWERYPESERGRFTASDGNNPIPYGAEI